MAVVRESPHAKRSPDKNPAQWPPKSPFQALLSSPSGRKKWQDYYGRAGARSPSPSPLIPAVSSSRTLQELVGNENDDNDEDEDGEEDEETLQLQLQEIQAKLRLRKMQKARKTELVERSAYEGSAARIKSTSPDRALSCRVQIPLSPIRKERPLQEQLSPARVKLGLRATSKAQDVSLKRSRDGSRIRRPDLPINDERLQKAQTFSEKIVEKERKANELEMRRKRLDSVRSRGFSGAPTVAETRSRPEPEPCNARLHQQTAESSRHGLLASGLVADQAHATDRRQPPPIPFPEDDHGLQHDAETKDIAGYDPFSQLHLSRRHIQHSVVVREMAGKEIYTLPRLLREVKSPDYEAPDCESDYVVFAILASKSSPFDQVQTHKQTNGHAPDNLKAPAGKFMVLHLCDLKWDIDLFLFGSAFAQFWKLTPGTLLGILNPAIMPPKGDRHNGRFSLKLGSSEDAVMEIGVARDLGFCISTKKDGKQCDAWIDKRKSEACEYHINVQIERSRKGRMEVNTMWRGTGPRNDLRNRFGAEQRKGEPHGRTYHREYGTLYSVNTGMGTSTANLLDIDDTNALDGMAQGDASRKRMAAAENERNLARQLGVLGNGVGAEYLRLKHGTAPATGHATADGKTPFFVKPSASDLGLLANKARDARLSPAKDRKRHFGLGTISRTTAGSGAMGWGGARKVGLLQSSEAGKGWTRLDLAKAKAEREAERPTQPAQQGRGGSMSPQKKRARFALEKGIREPGRESLPGESRILPHTGRQLDRNSDEKGSRVDDDDDDDDDDLDIV